MGTERKVKMKLSLKKLAQQQRGSMCQEEIGALCECLEKVCVFLGWLHAIVQHAHAQLWCF